MPTHRSPHTLLKLFESKKVVDLQALQKALGNVSAMTVFRYLKQIPYRSSYNHNGRYYTMHEPSRYDRYGLWSYGDIHFSMDGNLSQTVRRLVYEAEAGATHQELYERLRVRVHNTLYVLFRKGEIERKQVVSVYIYLHTDPTIQEVQLKHRNQQIVTQESDIAEGKINDRIVIQILLTLLRNPGAKAVEVVQHLYGHSPPISMDQVRTVFEIYNLDNIKEKGGSSNC